MNDIIDHVFVSFLPSVLLSYASLSFVFSTSDSKKKEFEFSHKDTDGNVPLHGSDVVIMRVNIDSEHVYRFKRNENIMYKQTS